jgi:hypothetical protein
MTSESSSNNANRKEPYALPVFKSYGNLAQITETVGNKGEKDGADPPKGSVKRTRP